MDPMSAAIRIGKENFAAGLFWQPAPTVMMAAREARIVAAKAELAADLFCVRKRGVPQFGLGQRKVGHKAGMRAIAPVLASAILESSWIGVFPANPGWLYVMVRRGAVMPDGDVLFTTEQEARQRLRSEMSIGDWDVIFAPAHWDPCKDGWHTKCRSALEPERNTLPNGCICQNIGNINGPDN